MKDNAHHMHELPQHVVVEVVKRPIPLRAGVRCHDVGQIDVLFLRVGDRVPAALEVGHGILVITY